MMYEVIFSDESVMAYPIDGGYIWSRIPLAPHSIHFCIGVCLDGHHVQFGNIVTVETPKERKKLFKDMIGSLEDFVAYLRPLSVDKDWEKFKRMVEMGNNMGVFGGKFLPHPETIDGYYDICKLVKKALNKEHIIDKPFLYIPIEEMPDIRSVSLFGEVFGYTCKETKTSVTINIQTK